MEPNVGVGFIPILQGEGPAISPKGKKEITFKPLEDGDKPHPYIGSCSAIFMKAKGPCYIGSCSTIFMKAKGPLYIGSCSAI